MTTSLSGLLRDRRRLYLVRSRIGDRPISFSQGFATAQCHLKNWRRPMSSSQRLATALSRPLKNWRRPYLVLSRIGDGPMSSKGLTMALSRPLMDWRLPYLVLSWIGDGPMSSKGLMMALSRPHMDWRRPYLVISRIGDGPMSSSQGSAIALPYLVLSITQ